MKLPGLTMILLYQFIAKGILNKSNLVELFDPLNLKSNKWIFEYFPENICTKRWQQGNQLYYLLNENRKPCSFAWIRLSKKHFIGEINRKLIFQNKVYCIFDCITPKIYRGKGYYPYLINQLSKMNSEYPIIIYASSDNVSSNKGIIKAGFELTHKMFRIIKIVKITDMDKSGVEFNVEKPK